MSHAEHWAGASYVAAKTSDEAPVSPSLRAAVGGVAIALTLGLAVGIGSQFLPHRDAVQATPRAEILNVEVAKPVVLPAPKAVGRLEVLPSDMISRTPRAVAAARPDPRPVEEQSALDARRFDDMPEMALPADEAPGY